MLSTPIATLINNYYKENYTFFSQAKYTCLLIPGHDLGVLEYEIGRLREKLYREKIKGSGKEYDLDGRDNYYIHVIIWDNEQHFIVAGCRIMSSFAVAESKYSYLEFSFPGLYQHLSKRTAFVEMGRVFVTKSYQKNYSSLLLLFRAVHIFCKKNKLRHLIGLASYDPEKHDQLYNEILIHSLKNAYFFDDSNPIPNPRFSLNIGIKDPYHIPEVSHIKTIREIENLLAINTRRTEKIPVLIRQYIERMRAKVLGFSQGKEFNNAVEILLCVDLMELSSFRAQKFLMAEEQG